MKFEERLSALEQRVAVLEGKVETRPSGARQAEFWALDYLEQHGSSTGSVVFAGNTNVESIGHYGWQMGLPVAALLQQAWSAAALVLAALAHPVRLDLLQAILLGKRSSHDLQALEGLGTSGQLYHHLKELQAAGWLKVESRGSYRVVAERVIPLLVMVLAALGENEP